MLLMSSLLTITAPGINRWLLIVSVFRTEPGFGAPETGSRTSAVMTTPKPEENEMREFSMSTWP